jgi:hypothetical protein
MKAQHHQRYEGTLEFVDLGSGDWILRLATGVRYRLELPATLWNALAGRAAQRVCVEANPSDTWTSTMSGLPTLLVHRII